MTSKPDDRIDGLEIAVALENAKTCAERLGEALAKLELALKPLRKMLLELNE